MKPANAGRAVASLQRVRELRVRVSQAALASAQKAMREALADQARCEDAVALAHVQRAAYEREVFDQMAFQEHTQTTVRDAMVRLKALALRIDAHREQLSAAIDHSASCEELQRAARRRLEDHERARLKVDELAQRLEASVAAQAQQREEEGP